MPSVVALIVAAGRGHRFGGAVPKQYVDIGSGSVVREAARLFLDHPRISGVRVVIHPDDEALYREAVSGLHLMTPVHGGQSRQESVRKGLKSLVTEPPDLVLIHDAARPYVGQAVVDRVIERLQTATGAIPAIPVNDTLKRAPADVITETVERNGLWRAQTPQGFRYEAIVAAHASAKHPTLTDDAAVAEAAGMDVAIVDGDPANVKITALEDLKPMNRAPADHEIRTGLGFDVHRFGPGTALFLCGIEIPFEKTLQGHSDADVALHALTDAVLGACGAGDIGDHFPPSDPQWRGASSAVFLARAAEIAREGGGEVLHVDVTIICEAPKIGPHRSAMRRRVAEILGFEQERVNIKATTTEGLGYCGRGEGIAAQAVASLRLPR